MSRNRSSWLPTSRSMQSAPRNPIRFSAYQFDSNQPETACHVIEVWGSGVEVWTSVRSVAAVIRRTCATGNYRIRVTH